MCGAEYLERFGGYSRNRDLGMLMYQVMTIHHRAIGPRWGEVRTGQGSMPAGRFAFKHLCEQANSSLEPFPLPRPFGRPEMDHYSSGLSPGTECHSGKERRVIRLERYYQRGQSRSSKSNSKEERWKRPERSEAVTRSGSGDQEEGWESHLHLTFRIIPKQIRMISSVPTLTFSPGVCVCLDGFLPLGLNSLGLCSVFFKPSCRVHLCQPQPFFAQPIPGGPRLWAKRLRELARAREREPHKAGPACSLKNLCLRRSLRWNLSCQVLSSRPCSTILQWGGGRQGKVSASGFGFVKFSALRHVGFEAVGVVDPHDGRTALQIMFG